MDLVTLSPNVAHPVARTFPFVGEVARNRLCNDVLQRRGIMYSRLGSTDPGDVAPHTVLLCETTPVHGGAIPFTPYARATGPAGQVAQGVRS